MTNIIRLFVFPILLILIKPSFGTGIKEFNPWDYTNSEIREEAPVHNISITGYILIRGIRIFSKYISPIDGDRCQMYPTCATYGIQAVEKHGAIMGLIMIADRLIHESNEMDFTPNIILNHRLRYLDPINNNDFWWYKNNNFTK